MTFVRMIHTSCFYDDYGAIYAWKTEEENVLL